MGKIIKNIKSWLKTRGPGIITGAADNDPAGLSTYSVAGAATGYSLLWLMVIATPILIAVESICARLGNVKKKGLAKIFKEHFPSPIPQIVTILLIFCNLITLGANISGMAVAFSLITRANYIFWVIPSGILLWYLILFKNYRFLQKFLLLLSAFFFTYILAAILAKPDWFAVLGGLTIPQFTFSPSYFLVAVGLMGTTLIPTLFYWQTSEEIEEHKQKKLAMLEIHNEEKFLAPGLIFSQIVTIFIMIATGATLYQNGIYHIQSAQEAAEALMPFAGQWASYLFSLGLIIAGIISIPIISISTAYVIADTCGWKDSLSAKIRNEKAFYVVITLSLFIGMFIALSGVNPINALFYSQVINGFLVPVLLVMILLISNNRKIMGPYINNRFDNFFAFLGLLITTIAIIGLFIKR